MPLNTPIDTIRYKVLVANGSEVGVLFKIRSEFDDTVMWQFYATEYGFGVSFGKFHQLTKYTLDNIQKCLENCSFERYNSTSLP